MGPFLRDDVWNDQHTRTHSIGLTRNGVKEVEISPLFLQRVESLNNVSYFFNYKHHTNLRNVNRSISSYSFYTPFNDDKVKFYTVELYPFN